MQQDSINTDNCLKRLSEVETYKILSSIGIKVADYELCQCKDTGIMKARTIGYPLVMKVVSPDIMHKSDAGCVEVGIKNDEEFDKCWDRLIENAHKYNPEAELQGVLLQKMMKNGIEIITGIKKDPHFGHLILFGLGGIFVEVMQDVSLRLIPINKNEAYEMITEIKGFKILTGIRGKKPADLEAIADVLVRLSKLVEECPEIEELDINPLFVYENGQGTVAADGLLIKSNRSKKIFRLEGDGEKIQNNNL